MTFSSSADRSSLLALAVAAAVMILSFSSDFSAPWTDVLDYNGACWSQSAHNTLRAGFRATVGVPSAFYFGSLPIPPEGFYTHHPPLLSILLAAFFAVLGEHEWVARLLPVGSSLVSLGLLWWLLRDLLNNRAAAFAALLFATMPMELRYGRMVNFEPVNQVWMLAALCALHRWDRSRRRLWLAAAFLSLIAALWTAWLGYLFAAVVCVLRFCHGKRQPRFSAALGLMMLISLSLFLLQMERGQPGSWRDMLHTLHYRAGGADAGINWANWSARIFGLLMAHIHPVTWALGFAGAWMAVRARPGGAERELARAALCFFAMSAIYVTAFRNASSIHDYASFYFSLPAAMMGALALDRTAAWLGVQRFIIRVAGWSIMALMLGGLAITGVRETEALRRPFCILRDDAAEPQMLIPRLGAALRGRFAPDVAIICNFMPTYGPHLPYYAQHDLLAHVYTPQEWRETISDPANAPVGGAIWMAEPAATEVLAALPPGVVDMETICGERFSFWTPTGSGVARAPALR